MVLLPTPLFFKKLAVLKVCDGKLFSSGLKLLASSKKNADEQRTPLELSAQSVRMINGFGLDNFY